MSQLFLFLKRTKSKAKSEPEIHVETSEATAEVIPRVENDALEIPEDRSPSNDIEDRLLRARFPVKTRADLMRALGGKDEEVVVGTNSYKVGEVVDRCFAGRSVFNSSHDVVDALNETSWIKVIMGKLNMLPFPVSTKNQLLVRLEDTYIEGIPVSELLDSVVFPIGSPSDLLAQLANPGTDVPETPTEGDAQEVQIEDLPETASEEEMIPVEEEMVSEGEEMVSEGEEMVSEEDDSGHDTQQEDESLDNPFQLVGETSA